MKQPKVVTIKKSLDRLLKVLPKGPLECKLQEREPGDDSKVVYVVNPKYIKGTTDPMTAAPLIALTQHEYKVVEWTKK